MRTFKRQELIQQFRNKDLFQLGYVHRWGSTDKNFDLES